mgnify:CR=1 FL=1
MEYKRLSDEQIASIMTKDSISKTILVENKFVIVSRAKEIIYNALNENNIEIPFPQQDIYIRSIAKTD